LQFPDRQQLNLEPTTMTREEVFPSKYLKAADLKGKPRIVKIESASGRRP